MPTTGFLAVLLAMATVDVPFGDHGIAVALPDWEYSEVSLQHYAQDKRNLDLTIFTRNLSNREDQDEGILLRFSPTIETYKDHIGERLSILRRVEKSPENATYQTWSFDDDAAGNPFDLAPLLRTLGLEPALKHESFLTDGEWHSYQAYFETLRGVYAIYVWDARSKPTGNPRVRQAFSLIEAADQHDLLAENRALTRAFVRREAKLVKTDIDATLTWVGMYLGRWNGEIDKGFDCGVERGMEFIITHDGRFRGALEITSVSEDSAWGTLHTIIDLPRPVVGDGASTRPPETP